MNSKIYKIADHKLVNFLYTYDITDEFDEIGEADSIFFSTEKEILVPLAPEAVVLVFEELPLWITAEAGEDEELFPDTVDIAPLSSCLELPENQSGEFRGEQFSTSIGMSKRTFI